MLAHPAYARRRPVYGGGTDALYDALSAEAKRVNEEHRRSVEEGEARKAALTETLVVGSVMAVLIGAQVFAVNPWIVKAFKPEWSYGRRLAASFGVTFLASTLVSAAKSVGGKG